MSYYIGIAALCALIGAAVGACVALIINLVVEAAKKDNDKGGD